ncbi:calcium/calmodulin-dependent protein kinase kinase [Clonorchis sinensis]|uniref:Calcium/calmodulin-dependent protein kinase kinase n=1 Tax=Clonorchis sinensis TaxID=79923 RepID=G7YV51_CLOSI|nr:calcium/calmodulin-dependent protein kinase kinase [Clonorchis sinensis]
MRDGELTVDMVTVLNKSDELKVEDVGLLEPVNQVARYPELYDSPEIETPHRRRSVQEADLDNCKEDEKSTDSDDECGVSDQLLQYDLKEVRVLYSVIKWIPQDETYRQYRIPEERSNGSILAKSSTLEHMKHPNVKKLSRECRIIQQLKHSNVVTFIRTITDDKRMKIGIVHRVQVVHRDINPNNLLRTTEEQIKITDFGLSEEYAEDRPLRGTIGTPQYLAPECVKEPGEPYDGKPVDVWALGMTLYWMIQREVSDPNMVYTELRQNYYDGENKYDIFEKIQREPAVVERQDEYVIIRITYAAR